MRDSVELDNLNKQDQDRKLAQTEPIIARLLISINGSKTLLKQYFTIASLCHATLGSRKRGSTLSRVHNYVTERGQKQDYISLLNTLSDH